MFETAFVWWYSIMCMLQQTHTFGMFKHAHRDTGGNTMLFELYLNKIKTLKKFNGTLISMNANTIFKKYV